MAKPDQEGPFIGPSSIHFTCYKCRREWPIDENVGTLTYNGEVLARLCNNCTDETYQFIQTNGHIKIETEVVFRERTEVHGSRPEQLSVEQPQQPIHRPWPKPYLDCVDNANSRKN